MSTKHPRDDDRSEPGTFQINAGPPSIDALADLESNVIYCNSQAVFRFVSRAQVADKFKTHLKVPSDCVPKLIPHCLSLRLLHYCGPFEKPQRHIILVATCVHDDSRNILIAKQLSSTEGDDTFQEYVGKTFTLKNFMVLPAEQLTLRSDLTGCLVGDKPLYSFIIVTSTDFYSTIKFYGEQNSKLESPNQDGNGPNASTSSISFTELHPHALSFERLLADDIPLLSTSGVRSSLGFGEAIYRPSLSICKRNRDVSALCSVGSKLDSK